MMTKSQRRKTAIRITLTPYIATVLALLLILMGSAVTGNAAQADTGYMLVAPINSKTVSLMDMDGNTVHSWN